MRVGLKTGALSLACALLGAAPAAAQFSDQLIGPYDGEIPFNCQLQDVGTGTAFPDPAADPFCVEFDKTNQNVTDLGIVDFALNEPARVAIAVQKCFYFQRDHWTGTIVQGTEPSLYHWDGDYFFDLAKGVGGVSVRNLTIGGVPMDATPFVPAAYRPYFDEDGGGGVRALLETNPDPLCTARVDTPAEAALVYANHPAATGCVAPGGKLQGSRVGAVRLGEKRAEVTAALGAPHASGRSADSWCLTGKGELRVAFQGRSGPATLIQSSGRGHSFEGVAHGDPARRAHRRLDLARRLRSGATKVFEAAASGGRTVLIGIAKRRVGWVAISAPRVARSDGRLRQTLDRLG